jgi:opacity protein-like surface antigen
MKKILAALLVTFVCASAQASLYVEPYLGYRVSGSGKQKVLGSEDKYDFKGPVMGTRLGYGILGFSAGLEYSLSSFDLEEDFGTKTKYETDGRDIGVFASFELPILFRVWATYHFSSQWKVKDGASKDKFKGNGFSLGAGYTGLPFVVLNLELKKLTFDEIAGVDLPTAGIDKFESTEIILSVSLPLNFF